MKNNQLKFSGLSFEFFLAVGFVLILCVFLLLSDYQWLVFLPVYLLYRLIAGSVREIIFFEKNIKINYVVPNKSVDYSQDEIQRIFIDYAFKWGRYNQNKLRIKTPLKKEIIIDLDATEPEYKKVAYLLRNENWKGKIKIDANKKVMQVIHNILEEENKQK